MTHPHASTPDRTQADTAAVLKRNNVTQRGAGQTTLLFAHGYGCDQNMWRLITPAFEQRYRVILFDHVGHGGSDASAYTPRKYDRLDGYADDLLDICEALQLSDTVFVGHSVSAMIGVLAAIRAPERFARLIMVSPSPRYIDDAENDYRGGFAKEDIDGLLDLLDSNYLGWTRTMAPLIAGNPDRPEIADELANSFCRTDPDIARQFAKVTFMSDNRSDLPSLRIASLILQCTDDVIAPPVVGEYLHRHLPASQLVLMDASGHCPNLSHPAMTIAAIQQYLHESGL